MKIVIKETGKQETLEVIGLNGIEWTGDLLGNAGFNGWNEEMEQFEMSQDDFDWWKEYIDNFNADEEDIEKLAEELNIDAADINLRMQMGMDCDMDSEHLVRQSILADIRAEYNEK